MNHTQQCIQALRLASETLIEVAMKNTYAGSLKIFMVRPGTDIINHTKYVRSEVEHRILGQILEKYSF